MESLPFVQLIFAKLLLHYCIHEPLRNLLEVPLWLLLHLRRSISEEIGKTVGFHNELLASWGPFEKDIALLADIASNRAAAIRLADQVGYDL